ncbi:MAG: HlyC/CorC family transporter, partial [Candidatus Aenigmarchaeota archaeon]|nr:HlyC/CorC family transporter [Candidatus Aenigmarchaeota archaeon]
MSEITIAILATAIVFSAFFSGVETALMSLNMAKVKALATQGKKGSGALYRIKQNPHRLIITILVGNNLVNIFAASLATVIFTEMFGSSGLGIATGVMTFLILVFGEIVPKTIAINKAERVALIVAGPIEALSYVLHPLIIFLDAISRALSRIAGSKDESQLSDEELKTIVTMGKEEGLLSNEAAEMMHNVLEFEGRVTKIMTPEPDVKMIDGKKSLRSIISYVVKMPYSRYPVYMKSRDNVVGILDVDDVLKYVKNKKLSAKAKDVAKKAYFVPESKEIEDLFSEFENKKIPLAIVVDEYGSVAGLVTLEDILEEIVGDIFDKSKGAKSYVKKIGKNVLKVDAKANLNDINKLIDLGFREKHVTTIAGFIEHKLQRIPQKGEKIMLKKASIEISEVTGRGIKEVIIRKVKP